MTTPLSVFALVAASTKEAIFKTALQVASAVGLPVETWRAGDPTRTSYLWLAEALETLDLQRVSLAGSSFLRTAVGAWLTLRAKDVYNVDRQEQTFATSGVVFVNAKGGFFELDARSMVVSNSTTGETYTNEADFVINPLSTSSPVTFVAVNGGARGTAAVDAIDTIQSPVLDGVTIDSSTAAIGTDEQSDPGLVEQCLATLGALSPNGPFDAYEFVARSEDLTGIAGVARAKSSGDNTTGTVSVYVATATAGLDGGSVAAIQAAIDLHAEPLCTVATVISAAPQTVAFTLALTPTHAEAQAKIEAALDAYLATVPLGGTVARSAVVAVVHNTIAIVGLSVSVTLPASDVVLAVDRFPVRGTVVLT